MDAAEPQTSSDEVRKKGNKLYKAGKLTEALASYKHASELDPSNAAPYSNIAAVRFELGEYDASISPRDSALALQSVGPEHAASREKVHYGRRSPAFIRNDGMKLHLRFQLLQPATNGRS